MSTTNDVAHNASIQSAPASVRRCATSPHGNGSRQVFTAVAWPELRMPVGAQVMRYVSSDGREQQVVSQRVQANVQRQRNATQVKMNKTVRTRRHASNTGNTSPANRNSHNRCRSIRRRAEQRKCRNAVKCQRTSQRQQTKPTLRICRVVGPPAVMCYAQPCP